MSILDIKWEMQELEEQFAADEKQIIKARTTTLRKTAKRAGVIVKKELSAKTKIPQKHLKNRFFVANVTPEDTSVELWIGTADVQPHRIAAPKQTKQGVRAGRGRFYKGAFFQNVYGNQKKVWIRKGSSYFQQALYPGKSGGSVPKELRHRFPVVQASIKIDVDAQAALDKNITKIEQEFVKIYQQELNFQVNVK